MTHSNSNSKSKRNSSHNKSGARSRQNNRSSNRNSSNSNRPAPANSGRANSRIGKTNKTTAGSKTNRTNRLNNTNRISRIDSTAFFNPNFNARTNNIRPPMPNVSRMANMALPHYGTGAVDYPGRIAKRRVHANNTERQKFHNTRKHIITGRELTTPLRKRGLAAAEAKTEVNIKVKTINVAKKMFPISAIFYIVIIMGVCLFLVFSKMVLNEYIVNISSVQSRIAAAQKDEAYIIVQLEVKDNLFEFEKRAIELGMIKEDALPKKYLSLKNKDKVEILGGNDGIFTRLADILPQIFSGFSE